MNKGQWMKGQSGNPRGRPKGSKNRLVWLREQLEIAVREHMEPKRVKKIIDAVAELAESGNARAAQLILDKLLPNATKETL